MCVLSSGDEWKRGYSSANPSPLPILAIDGTAQHTSGLASYTVISEKRYVHCTRILGFRPEPKFLRRMPMCNINQICRDDLMHLVLAGMFEHVLGAVMSFLVM